MQTVVIDLRKSPDIATAVTDLEPGDDVTLHGTLKSLDTQTAVVTITELEIPGPDEEAEEEADDYETPSSAPDIRLD